MSERPKVSVIMAVRNSEDTVSQTIDSILSQTFRNFEFVIVDDASDDSTGCILERYAKKDKRVRVLTNKVRKERAVSRNLAIKESRGEYVAVTDGDDISFSNRLDVEVTYLERNPEVYMVGSRAELIDESGLKIGKSFGKKEALDITDMLVSGNVLVHSSIMFRNTGEFQYREKFKYAQDYDLFLQMVAQEKRIVLLPNVLVKYRSKSDLVYDDYLVQQYMYSAKARQLLKESRKGIEGGYEEFNSENLEEEAPLKLKTELKFLSLYTHGKFKEAREQMRVIFKEYGYTPKRILYFIDTFTKGKIFHSGKQLKRFFIRLLKV